MATHKSAVAEMLETLKELVQQYPESLERRDGVTMLHPFQEATACATEHRPDASVLFPEEMPLSIVYMLLREDPLLVNSGVAE
jgi:hypothetical protein